ncbi:cell division protein ZapE [Paraburkholderia terricola]|jgi:cell division protein ZapE|uniref:cell division protein ZapE n=2 Tax=Paraburkholderia terricola TaxID=169427 RepID=UPI0028557A83|nr:cell division protein ZapE [Paraburkholderia terricola]MDR6450485.1 cell division protein ZapE [Paraburkholderia terricola]
MIDEARVVSTLASRAIVPDDSQHRAIAALVALLGVRMRRNWLGHPLAVPGVYCYGLPGRGKSLVVDTVFELAGCAKRRIHFHEFLREMNQRLVNAPHHDDRLAKVSRRWLDGVELLCFDEFHVHDIADAFLIGRFLDVALECGTRIVLTSNYAPQGLLPNPEFHERFQPTIERIEQHFTIIHFDGSRDYRFGGEQASPPRFFASLDVATGEQLRTIFLRYESEHALTPQTLSAAGRPLAVRAAGSALLWADFDALCVENRSHLDYLELAERWRGLIVGQLDTRWLARPQTLQRFVWLVDIFYDHKRALFIASNLPLAAELNGLQGAHDLSRTLSRLAEMQSRAYLNPLDGAPLSSEVITFPPANTSFSRLTCSHENS